MILLTLLGNTDDRLELTTLPECEKFLSLGVLVIGIDKTFLAKRANIGISVAWSFQNIRIDVEKALAVVVNLTNHISHVVGYIYERESGIAKFKECRFLLQQSD